MAKTGLPPTTDPRPPATRLAWEVIVTEDALIVIVAIVLQIIRNVTSVELTLNHR